MRAFFAAKDRSVCPYILPKETTMTNDLQVVEQKTVLFYEDEITAVRVADGTISVPIRPICDHLGVN